MFFFNLFKTEKVIIIEKNKTKKVPFSIIPLSPLKYDIKKFIFKNLTIKIINVINIGLKNHRNGLISLFFKILLI